MLHIELEGKAGADWGEGQRTSNFLTKTCDTEREDLPEVLLGRALSNS